MRRILALAVVLVLALPASASAYIYWTPLFGVPAIGRANLDGTTVNTRYLSVDADRSLATDGSHLYWTTINSISRANLDRSDVRANLITDATGPFQLALDANYLYWANAGANAVGRANRDGTGVNQQFISGININGVAVDSTHVYWSSGYAIGRANLDGSNVQARLIEIPGGGLGSQRIATDGTYVYWVNTDRQAIGRARTDGSEVNLDFITGPVSNALAVHGQHIYWADGSAIARANRDGTAINRKFIQTPEPILGLAVNAPTSVATTTTLTPSSAPTFYGDPSLTFTAQVTATTGSVQFEVDGEPDGAPVALNAQGRAVYDSSFYLDVDDTVTARYLGDAAHDPSSAQLEPGILPARTSVTVTSSSNPSALGEDAMITATVTNSSTAMTPYGTVEFLVDGERVTPPLELDDAGEVAVIGGADLAAGDHSIEVRYRDDTAAVANFAPSQGFLTQRIDVGPMPAPPVRNAPPTILPPPPQRAPMPAFSVSRVTAARNGTIKVLTQVPEPGTIHATARAAGVARYGVSSVTRTSRGAATIAIKPRTAARRALAKNRRLRVSVTITFAARAGGPPQTVVRRVVVVRSRR